MGDKIPLIGTVEEIHKNDIAFENRARNPYDQKWGVFTVSPHSPSYNVVKRKQLRRKFRTYGIQNFNIVWGEEREVPQIYLQGEKCPNNFNLHGKGKERKGKELYLSV